MKLALIPEINMDMPYAVKLQLCITSSPEVERPRCHLILLFSVCGTHYKYR